MANHTIAIICNGVIGHYECVEPNLLKNKLKGLFSRKQQGEIRTDWKIFYDIFYHLCIVVTIFQVATSLSILSRHIFHWHNTENRWKVIIYLPMLIET